MAFTSPTPFPYLASPISNISPFTYADGITYLEKLELLRVWLNTTLVPSFAESFDSAVAEFQAGLTNAELTTTVSLADWTTRFDAFMADVTTQLAGLNDTAFTGLIGNTNSTTRPALVALINSLSVSDAELDPAVTALVTTNATATRTALIALIKNLSVTRGDQVFDVRDYGASTTLADNTAAVRSAVAALKAAGGGVLYYGGAGDYVQHSYVEVPDNMTVKMAPGAWIRKTTASTTYVVFVALAKLTTGYNGVKNFKLIGCNMRGNLGAGVSINPLSAHRASGITARGCRFWETSQNGHVLDLQGCENVLVEENDIRGIKKIAGRAYVEAIQIDSSVSTGTGFDAALVAGEFFDGTPTRNVRVRKNYFGPITVDGVTYPAQVPMGSHSYVDGKPYTNLEFTDNVVENVVETDGGYPGIIHFVAVQGAEISRNKVYGNGTNKNTFVRFFRGGNAIPFSETNNPNAVTAPPTIKINPKNVLVDNNEVTGLDVAAPLVWIYGELGWLVPNLHVTRNRFFDCQLVAGSGTLIQATYTSDAQVIGNRGSNCGFGAIVVGDSENPSVADNSGNGGTGNPIKVYDCVSPVVSRNQYRGYTSWLEITGSSDIEVKSNGVSVTGATAAVKIISPPATPGFINLGGNTLKSTNAGVVTADAAFGISTAYVKGLVSANLAKNYATAADVNAGVSYADNVTV